MDPAEARRIMGPDAIIGLSTHSREQIEAAASEPVDYISVGPIWETPDQGGAARHRPRADPRRRPRSPRVPWFAIGGIDPGNVGRGRRRPAPSASASSRAIRDAAGPARRGHGAVRRGRPRGAGRAGELMAGARDRKRAERQKRKRRSAERPSVPVEAPPGAASRGRATATGAHRDLPGEDGPPLRGAERRGPREARAARAGRAADGGHRRARSSRRPRGDLHRLGGPRDRRSGCRRPRHQARSDRRLRDRLLGDGHRHVARPLLGRARLPDPAPADDARQRVRPGGRQLRAAGRRDDAAAGRIGHALLLHDPRDGAHPDARRPRRDARAP